MITFTQLGKYGRFGNQLWQIASTIGIAKRNDEPHVFPDWEYSQYFKHALPQESYSSLFSSALKIHEEKKQTWYDVALNGKWDWDLRGYFQSLQYIEKVEDEIQYYFDLKDEHSTLPYVSLHVRRGDYVGNGLYTDLYAIGYYDVAINEFPGDTFLVFSDDIEFVSKHFNLPKFIICKTGNVVEDFAMMRACKAHIIANSSFSWWAAYLSGNRTIMPGNWYSGRFKEEIPIGGLIKQDWIVK